MRPILIVFARAPLPGSVKTRLTTSLSHECAREIHVAMVTDLVGRLQQMRSMVDLELHTDHPAEAFSFSGVPQRSQVPGDLGNRIHAAISGALDAGRRAVMILGSDSPTLPLSNISALLGAPTDVSLGPTTDGGFYAIACRRAHRDMFKGVAWSSPETCAETAEAIRRCGLSVHFGPSWYDIDTPADLCRLAQDPNLGAATRSALSAAGQLPL